MKSLRLISFVVFMLAVGWSQQVRAYSLFQCPQTPGCVCYTHASQVWVEMFCDGGEWYPDECSAFQAECNSYCALYGPAVNECNEYFGYGDCECKIIE